MSTPNEFLRSIREIVSRVLKVPIDQITPESGPKTLRNWDSLRHVELVLEVEEAFGVSFAPAEVFALTSVQGFCDMLLQKKAAA